MIYVNSRFLAQAITGVQRYSLEMSKELCRLDQSLTFVGPRDLLHERDASRLDVVRVSTGRGYWWEQVQLPRYLNMCGRPLLINLGNVAPLMYERSVVVLHDVSFLRYPQRYSRLFLAAYKFVIPRIVKRALKIITDSEFSKKEIVELLGIGDSKVDVVPCGVSPAFSPSTVGSATNTPSEYVLTVSSLDPAKNIGRLIEAFEDPRLRDVKLVVVGAGNRVFRSPALTRPGSSTASYIHFTGYVTDEELVRLYRNAALFVFPSLYEGFGLPPLEAMACGCPVVSSHAASMPEVCGNAAYYVNPESSESIAEGILTVLSDSRLRDELRQAGVERASTFRWQDAAGKLLRIARAAANDTTHDAILAPAEAVVC
jgi:glycosyltransferase involved in cell wall biosynthesis